jgi:hypothetical protein
MKRRGGTMAKSIRDAMTEDPRSIGASAPVVEAARLMREEHIGSLPITRRRAACRDDHGARHHDESGRRDGRP